MATMPPSDSDATIDDGSASARGRRLRAIGLMCLTMLLFAVLDTTGKYLMTEGGLPVIQVVWVRLASQLAFTLAILGPLSLPRLAATNKLAWQLLRSSLMLGVSVLNFVALKYLQLDQNTTIFYLAPLAVAALAGPLLGEWIDWRRALAIGLGFLGILVVIQPGFAGFQWAYLVALGATLTYALYNISTRYLSAFDGPEVTLFYSTLVGIAATAPFALAVWQWPQDLATWAWLISMGISGGIAHWLLILAHRDAPAPILAPFVYTGLLWMSLGGYLVFGDLPALTTLAGCAVVIASGLYLISRERRRQV